MPFALESCAEPAAGVVQRLVERAAGGGEALGKHVDRDLVERKGGEDLALVRGQLGLDRPLDGAQELVDLDGLCAVLRPSATAAQRSASNGSSRPCQARRRSLTAASRTANLYAQVLKRLAPR